MKNKSNKQLIQSLAFLLVFIVICAVLARLLTGSETLAETAEKAARENHTENITYNNKEDTTYNIEETDIKDGEEVVDKTDKNLQNEQDIRNDETVIKEENNITGNNRIVYRDGFYYEELTEQVKKRINGISYPVSSNDDSVINKLAEGDMPAVSYDDLRYLSVLYYDFRGVVQTGELICNKGIAQDLAEIFYELYVNEYQIEKIRLVDEYMGDDMASMADNNTSCFNYRVVDGTTSLSKHALGCAIDINPFYNPYVIYNRNGSGETYISPAGSEVYADRSNTFPYKIDENDLCYKLFIDHGFIWGGNWNSSKDYQHFQKVVE